MAWAYCSRLSSPLAARLGSSHFTGTPYGRTVLGLHKLAGNLMWAYLIGHASMALLHQALGDKVFSRMFGFGAQARNSPAPAE